MTRRVVIMGAAGRDFQDFNSVFREDDDHEVVAFTQTFSQNIGELDEIPERTYPASLAGENYPDGVPILPESELETIVEERDVDEVVLSYSDLSHEYVMNQASRAISAGADFRLVGTRMMYEADIPVVAVDAVRTGCGKSQAARKLASILREETDKEVIVVREPMPYGDLENQRVQRFETLEDLERHDVTIEEREEYEHHIEEGHVVYAGVDYEDILAEVEEEADILLWDGGNNELPFYVPDVHFVLADPHRPGHELRYHPGEANLRIADYVVINKENTANEEDIQTIVDNVESANPDAGIIHADSVITVEDEAAVKDARVLAVEDGPTLTHGGTSVGAASIAAEQFGAGEVVDPRPHAVGSIADVFEDYDHLGNVLPAMGYSEQQLAELEQSIANVDCDVVLAGTPIDLSKIVDVDTPIVRVRYEIEERGDLDFEAVLEEHADVLGL
ncbi:putative GTPase [Halalkaliarchaeum desulfuricum]|uniref:Putative GTPase n=1 Tax=Halalkaliarchaeum desulfuricum TaxID=2055893 RepID=A0A343TG07_9EURY|nr:GTPase [Halalkaliarchaeum desulfuricum]AUX08029.1 putative GTPase [Halalkaliarchaeum desulfuricum]